MSAPAEVVIVPGLAVRRYLEPTVRAVEAAGASCEMIGLPTRGPALSIHGYANLVAARIQARGRSVVLVGHSAGTQVAALAATQVPVARLVLGSPTIDPAYRTVPRVLRRWWLDGRQEPSSLAPQQRQEWRQAGPRRILVLFRSMLRHRLEETVAGLTCPITVVRGEHDPLCTPRWTQELAQGSTLITMPGLPHAFPYQDPAGFAETILGTSPPR
jgi:pimeloyl-ACP methyl ester carboxylesterase